jgi:hypothetical protein
MLFCNLVFLKRMTGKAAMLASRERMSMMERRARLCNSPLTSNSLYSTHTTNITAKFKRIVAQGWAVGRTVDWWVGKI